MFKFKPATITTFPLELSTHWWAKIFRKIITIVLISTSSQAIACNMFGQLKLHLQQMIRAKDNITIPQLTTAKELIRASNVSDASRLTKEECEEITALLSQTNNTLKSLGSDKLHGDVLIDKLCTQARHTEIEPFIETKQAPIEGWHPLTYSTPLFITPDQISPDLPSPTPVPATDSTYYHKAINDIQGLIKQRKLLSPKEIELLSHACLEFISQSRLHEFHPAELKGFRTELNKLLFQQTTDLKSPNKTQLSTFKAVIQQIRSLNQTQKEV